MQADKPNESEIKKQVEKLGRLRTDMMLAMVDKRLAVKKILTDEQQTKLKELRKDRINNFKRGERGERKGPGFGLNEEGFENFFFGGIDEDFDTAPPAGQEL